MAYNFEQTKAVENQSSGTSTAATYDTTPTLGNVLFAAYADSDNSLSSIGLPSGWTGVDEISSQHGMAFCYKISDGTEGSVEFTPDITTGFNTVWLAEVSGLTGSTPHVSIVSNNSSFAVASQTTGTTTATTADNCLAIAFGSVDAGQNSDPHTWSNSFTDYYESTVISGYSKLIVATKSLTATGSVETTLTPSASDNLAAGLIVWEEAATSTTGTFDNIDVTAITTPTVGSPFTSASHSITADFTDGTDSASLAVTYNPQAGYAVQEVASAVKTTGSVFENFVGTIPDTSQVYYPTANNTSVDATGVLTTDATSNFYMHYWDATSGEWDQFEVIVTIPLGTATLSGDNKLSINLGLSI